MTSGLEKSSGYLKIVGRDGHATLLDPVYINFACEVIADCEEFKCVGITALLRPTHDHARSVITLNQIRFFPGYGDPEYPGPIHVRLYDSAVQVRAAFRNAGFKTLPRVALPSRLSRFCKKYTYKLLGCHKP